MHSPSKPWLSKRQLCFTLLLSILACLTACRSASSLSTRQLTAANLFRNQSTALTFDYYIDPIALTDTQGTPAAKNILDNPERPPLRRLHIHGRANVADTTAATFSENISSFQHKTSERAGAIESHFCGRIVLAIAFLCFPAIALLLLRLYNYSGKRPQ